MISENFFVLKWLIFVDPLVGDQRHGQLAFGAEGQERAVRGVNQVGIRISGEAGQRWHKKEDGNVLVTTVFVRGIVRGELVVLRAYNHHHRAQANPTIMTIILLYFVITCVFQQYNISRKGFTEHYRVRRCNIVLLYCTTIYYNVLMINRSRG